MQDKSSTESTFSHDVNTLTRIETLKYKSPWFVVFRLLKNLNLKGYKSLKRTNTESCYLPVSNIN